jgi:hypothetical protein
MAGQSPAPLPHLGLVLHDADASSWGQAPLPHLMSVLGDLQFYVMPADQGSYSITGQAALFPRNYAVAANVGFYTVAGKSASLTASVGRSGDPAPLPHLGLLLAPGTAAHTLIADPGIYHIVGSDALADFEVDGEQGTYTLAGQDAALRKTTIMQAESGSYSVSGQELTFSIGSTDRVMPADTSTYSITGQDAGLRVSRKVSAEQGFYAIQGRAADLAFNPPAEYTLLAEGGSYSTVGQAAALNVRILYAESGVYTITGYTVTDLPSNSDTGAGKSSQTKKPRKKLTVEIDGEVFAVGSREEAAALLAQAKEAAEEQARLAVERAVKAERRPTRRVLADARKALKPPEIVASEELVAEAESLTKEIEAIYQDAMVKVEIAALMRREEEDEEEALLLLL